MNRLKRLKHSMKATKDNENCLGLEGLVESLPDGWRKEEKMEM